MTVLQMRDTDEETNQPPTKKLRFSISRLRAEEKGRSIQAWVNTVNNAIVEAYPISTVSETMMNGYGLSDSFHQPHTQRSSDENNYSDSLNPIAPLLNLGNTCFLNSVLYTLRFAPSFLHKLHHLNSDSITFIKYLNANKPDRSYSLGRNLGKSGTWGNKDTFACNVNGSEMKTLNVISRLHQLYAALWSNETRDRMEPFQPNSFLHALRDVNAIFEGNQQHDAHELLVCLLDIIREACEMLYQQNHPLDRPNLSQCTSSTSSSLKSFVIKKSLKIGRIMHSDKSTNYLRENYSEGDMRRYLTNGYENNSIYAEDRYSFSQDTIFDDFQGVSLLRTTCLECEHVTERKENFCDICVPIETIDNYEDQVAVDRLYQSKIVTEELLIECNKYWCEKCSTYNEAKQCVKYERLPRLLTLHLKRFSSGFGSSVSKVNEFMPTPLTLSCFCEECSLTENENERPHYYNLYAIIMHLGAAIASGHYVAYVRMFDITQDYMFCTKDKSKTSSLSRGYSVNSTSSNSVASISSDKPHSIIKYFKKLSSKSFSNGSSASTVNTAVGFNPTKDCDLLRDRIKAMCKAAECCSVKLRGVSSVDQDVLWLECDDESVRTISTQELKDMLAPNNNKNSALTPYLLFYSKADS